MPQSFLPYQNNSLGVSQETFVQFWQQFGLDISDGTVIGTVASDMSVSYALTNAQLLALNATAVQLVAPPITTGLGNLIPPNGYLYVPTSLTVEYRFLTAGFTLGNADNRLQIEYTGQAVNMLSMLATGLLTLGSNAVATNAIGAVGPITTLATSANLGLEVKLAGTTPGLTVGAGSAVIHMLYNIYALI